MCQAHNFNRGKYLLAYVLMIILHAYVLTNYILALGGSLGCFLAELEFCNLVLKSFLFSGREIFVVFENAFELEFCFLESKLIGFWRRSFS